jgi:hypothetical protein
LIITASTVLLYFPVHFFRMRHHLTHVQVIVCVVFGFSSAQASSKEITAQGMSFIAKKLLRSQMINPSFQGNALAVGTDKSQSPCSEWLIFADNRPLRLQVSEEMCRLEFILKLRWMETQSS